MSAIEEPVDERPKTGDSWLTEIVHPFEEAWAAGRHPNIDDHLPADPAKRSRALIELVHIDLERRLKASEAIRVETYLARYPELASNPGLVVELIQAEYAQRRGRDSNVTLGEYLQRFPQYHDQLRQLHDEYAASLPDSQPQAIDTGPELVRGSQEELPAQRRDDQFLAFDHLARPTQRPVGPSFRPRRRSEMIKLGVDQLARVVGA